METPLILFYTYRLRGNLALLPRLYTFLRRLRGQYAADGRALLLDLGEAREVAEVLVNGKHAGYAWHAPYTVDIGELARKGPNRLEVRVANLWVNRLVGDAQPGVTEKITWTALSAYRPDAPLRRSGLIGPVRLLGEE